MCGAKIAIIVFSLAGKPFTFGNPDIDDVLQKYLTIPLHVSEKRVQKSWRSEEEYKSILDELDAENKRHEKLTRQGGNKDVDSLWRRDIDCLTLDQLREFSDSINEFKKKIVQALQEKEPMKFKSKALDKIEADGKSYLAMLGEKVDCNGSSSNDYNACISNEGCLNCKKWSCLLVGDTYCLRTHFERGCNIIHNKRDM